MARRRTPATRAAARYAAALLLFGTVHFYVERQWDWRIGMAVVRLGEACGAPAAWMSGRLAIGTSGPFWGDDRGAAAFNWLWRQTWIAAPLAGFAAAALPVLILPGRAPRHEPGVTACGWCGYALRGLKEPRCPECGRAI